MRARRAHCSVAAILALGLLITGCGGLRDAQAPAPTLPTLWKQAFDQALADPNLSDFERKVLSTYMITPGQYKEAQDLFVQCMKDRGWTVTWNDGGGYNVSGAPAHESQAPDPNNQGPDAMACQVGTIAYIQPIYLGMHQNPEGKSSEQLIRDCYRAHGIPDGADLSSDAFAQMIDAIDYRPSSAQGALCFFDPTGSLGLTLDQAEAMNQ